MEWSWNIIEIFSIRIYNFIEISMELDHLKMPAKIFLKLSNDFDSLIKFKLLL